MTCLILNNVEIWDTISKRIENSLTLSSHLIRFGRQLLPLDVGHENNTYKRPELITRSGLLCVYLNVIVSATCKSATADQSIVTPNPGALGTGNWPATISGCANTMSRSK